jgi:hypothetical protein
VPPQSKVRRYRHIEQRTAADRYGRINSKTTTPPFLPNRPFPPKHPFALTLPFHATIPSPQTLRFSEVHGYPGVVRMGWGIVVAVVVRVTAGVSSADKILVSVCLADPHLIAVVPLLT